MGKSNLAKQIQSPLQEKEKIVTGQEATAKILGKKQKLKLSWEQIAKGVGRHKIWTTAALFGQHPMAADEAESVIKILGFSGEEAEAVALALQEYPMASFCPTRSSSQSYLMSWPSESADRGCIARLVFTSSHTSVFPELRKHGSVLEEANGEPDFSAAVDSRMVCR
ncbi:MAG: hypothetical protein FJ143_13355 [Deltaproteobacteria bacterium]|nr:hypothetical protein [Deltaproteobacteria bacterium]